jgi:hypothetical protein
VASILDLGRLCPGCVTRRRRISRGILATALRKLPPFCRSSGTLTGPATKSLRNWAKLGNNPSEVLEPPDDSVERHRGREALAQTALYRAHVYQHQISDPAITPLRGLVDDLVGCSVEIHLPEE